MTKEPFKSIKIYLFIDWNSKDFYEKENFEYY